MSATILTPVHLVCTTSLSDLTAAPAAGKVRRYDVRAANTGSASASVDLVLTDGSTTIYRCKTYPVGFNDLTAAPDLELALVVPAGWKLQAKASAGTTIEVSANGVEADATDFS